METDKEHENAETDRKDRSPSPAVKSRAVVKYTSVPTPVGFARLQCNTDLNRPPSNWLSGTIDPYGLKRILSQGTGFSSFRMAHMFPDCVGEVDVVSGAECIKTLLKLPYQPNSNVSMMVHRVENTLLLDEFNIYEYLMKSEWSWLRDFFYENILKTMSEQERVKMLADNKATTALQLTSKFLCHSVATQPEPQRQKRDLEPAVPLAGASLPEPEAEVRASDAYSRNVLWTFEDIQMLIGSDLPIFGGADRPCVSLRLRDATQPINVLTGIDYWLDNLMCNVPEVLMCYHIDGIVQKYEPMKTEDLPHMEGSKFSPKVIRNVAQNILSFLKSNATRSGHTYWLFKGAHDDVVKLYDLTSLCGGLGASNGNENPFTTPVAMLLYRVARNMRLTRKTRHVKLLLDNAVTLLSAETHPQIVASSHYMLSDVYLPSTTNPAAPQFKDESSDSDCEEEVEFDKVDLDSRAREDRAPVSADHAPTGTVSAGHAPAAAGHVPDDTESDDADEQQDSQLALKMSGLAMHDIGKSIRKSHPEKSKSKTSVSLGTDPPDRCGKALHHALLGLQALHNITIDKCMKEEKERLRQQRLLEEQNIKMANPSEPISMGYAPLKREDHKPNAKQKEHNSRNRRRKRERKTSEKSGNSLIESKCKIDKNAITIRKEHAFSDQQEPNRSDNFAWKLHLKTLLYEKACLAYATLAEFSYKGDQYGFSLKYIGLASKCQRLLNNMIIKSRVVDESCLAGRAGDCYFQLSKHWSRLEQFQLQFHTDHDTDKRLRQELERDLNEESENLNVVVTREDREPDMSLPASIVDAMKLSCEQYQLALSVADSGKRSELQRRLASVTNELGVRYMHMSQEAYVEYVRRLEEKPEEARGEGDAADGLQRHRELAAESLRCLDAATDMFQQVNDAPNLALLYCNKGRYMRFKAHCQFDSHALAATGGEDRRAGAKSCWRWYDEAEQLYAQALKVLGAREASGAADVWDLICWELSSATYTRAALLQDHATGTAHADAQEVIDALKNALKHCHTSPGKRQYLYQFRAAMIYHRLGAIYHKQYRQTTEEGTRRRTLMSLTRSNYEHACELFATLEDTAMYLTVAMEHVAALETQATLSASVKLASLQSALQLVRRCRSVVQLVASGDGNPDEVAVPGGAEQEKAPGETLSEHSLLSLLADRLQFILKSLIQYCRSRSNRDYDKMAAAYKLMYSSSLKLSACDDVRQYAGGVALVLQAIDDISAENSL